MSKEKNIEQAIKILKDKDCMWNNSENEILRQENIILKQDKKMKIIDILNKKAEGTLEDGFTFCYEDMNFEYSKEDEQITESVNLEILGDKFALEEILNDEVEILEKDREISELIFYKLDNTTVKELQESLNISLKEMTDKINEAVRVFNKLTKKSREAEIS